MDQGAIDRIRRVDLREVWKHEALNLTTWMEQNLDVLNDFLDVALDPETVRREEAAGAFAVDLVAEDENGETVVIENQLGRSDHDHLGKVLTYLAAFDATKAIWIVGDPRPEHVKAVTWLNDSSPAAVWLVKLEAIRIGDSPAAALLTTIVGPSSEAKKIAVSKREKSTRHAARRAFFEQLLKVANTRTRLHSGRTGTDGPYLGGTSGFPGVQWTYGVTMHGTSVILWIERGAGAEEESDRIFRSLLEHRQEIEDSFGAPLDWEAKESNRSRKVRFGLDGGGWSDMEQWPEAVDATVDAMVRLDRAVSPHLPSAMKSIDRIVGPRPSVELVP